MSKAQFGRSKNVSSVALGQYRCRSDIAVRIDCTRLQVPGRQIGGYCSECYNAYASQALPRARLYVTQPLGRRSIKSFVYNDPAALARADDLVVRRPIAGWNHAD